MRDSNLVSFKTAWWKLCSYQCLEFRFSLKFCIGSHICKRFLKVFGELKNAKIWRGIIWKIKETSDRSTVGSFGCLVKNVQRKLIQILHLRLIYLCKWFWLVSVIFGRVLLKRKLACVTINRKVNKKYVTALKNFYICIFPLYDINNKINIQFCLNTFDHVISFV